MTAVEWLWSGALANREVHSRASRVELSWRRRLRKEDGRVVVESGGRATGRESKLLRAKGAKEPRAETVLQECGGLRERRKAVNGLFGEASNRKESSLRRRSRSRRVGRPQRGKRRPVAARGRPDAGRSCRTIFSAAPLLARNLGRMRREERDVGEGCSCRKHRLRLASSSSSFWSSSSPCSGGC